MAAAALTSVAASKLFRIRRTVCAMLIKRGYVVLDEDANMRVEEFAAAFGGDIPNRERMGLLVFKRDDENDKLFVFFPGGDVGVPQCKECVGLRRVSWSSRAWPSHSPALCQAHRTHASHPTPLHPCARFHSGSFPAFSKRR
jgi:hypothetical protein